MEGKSKKNWKKNKIIS